VGAPRRPAQLLLLDHALADDPVDGLTADSTKALEIASPAQYRSP
jgi:hypothetical protein